MTPIPAGVPAEHGYSLHRDLADIDSYERIAIEGMGEVNLARSGSYRCRDIRELIQAIAACSSGRTLLSDIQALSKQGAQIAICSADDRDSDDGYAKDDHVCVKGTSGEIVWHLEYEDPWWRIGTTNPEDVKSVIKDLVRIRNLAAERMWPGVPRLSSEDVASAYQAELALSAAPSLGEWRFDSFAPLGDGFNPLLGANSDFDSLDGIMPVLGAVNIRAELIDVLQVIAQTPVGESLLKELQVYGRSSAVMSIEPVGTENRSYSFTARGGTWFARKPQLAQRAQTPNLTRREAYASGFFENLLRARQRLADSLGMLKSNIDDKAIQKQFETQLIERRQARISLGARQDGSLRSNGSPSQYPNGLSSGYPNELPSGYPNELPSLRSDESPSRQPEVARTVPPSRPRKPKASSIQGSVPSRGSAATTATAASSAYPASSGSMAYPAYPASSGSTVSSVTANAPVNPTAVPRGLNATNIGQTPNESSSGLRSLWNSARRVIQGCNGASAVNSPGSRRAIPNIYSRT